MRKIHMIGRILIPLLLIGCRTRPWSSPDAGNGEGFEKPSEPPPGLAFKMVSRADLSSRSILAPSGDTRGGVKAVVEIVSPRIAAADLLESGKGFEEQNKYLKAGMWIRIPVDPANPGDGKYTVKMLFTNIDVYLDGGPAHPRLPFNTSDPFVRASYGGRGLPIPGPVTLELDVKERKAYAEGVKRKYLAPLLEQDGDYADVPGIYYLVPKERMDWAAIRAEVALAEHPRSLEDFLIDGRLFGTWLPIEEMRNNSEAKAALTETGVFVLEIHSWPADDRSHVGF